MRGLVIPLAFTFASCAVSPALSVHLPLYRRAASKLRGFTAAVKQPDMQNANNSWYYTEINLGGTKFTVQLDTGSDDLWVYPITPITNFSLSRIEEVNVTYGVGSVVGPVGFAPMSLGSYSIESQAFINATRIIDMDIETEYDGLMGLAFDTLDGSTITSAIDETYNDRKLGLSPILNIFSQNDSLPNIVTIYMDRTGDLEMTSQSSFTIGEYVEGLEHIQDEPKLPRFIAKDGITRWTILMDGMEVNGVSINIQTSAQGVPSGKTVALMDTGTSFALVPAAVASAIYSNITDAFYSRELGAWVLPCTVDPSNVTFIFAGKRYDIHPLDLSTIQNSSYKDIQFTFCTGAFQPNHLGPEFSGFDFLLGDSFLRNVYALYYYGKFNSKKEKLAGNPYIQMLSITNLTTTFADFSTSRLETMQSNPPEASSDLMKTLFGDKNADDADNADVLTAADSSSSNSTTSLSEVMDSINHYGPIIIGLLAGNIFIGIILVAVGVSMCVRRGGTISRRRKTYAPVITGDEPFQGKHIYCD